MSRTTLASPAVEWHPTATSNRLAAGRSESTARPAVPRIGRTPPGGVVLQVDGLQKRFGTTEAVAGVTFEIRQGEVFGLLGRNGAGKTTTIAMLATARRPSGGDALVFGESVRHAPQAVRRLIGVVPQDLAVYPGLTAAENLRFFGQLYGVRGGPLEARIAELLDFVGLDGHRDEYVATFSGGMKRRLNVAVALVHGPRLLLLDEPTVGVDPQSREHLFGLVHRLRDSGHAILYTTHYMEEAEALCDRLGIMDHGKLIAMGTLEDLLAEAGCGEVIEVRGLRPGTDLAPLKAGGDVCRIEKRGDGVLRLFVTTAARLLGPLQRIINRSPHPVHVRIAPLRLEHVFLQLTGMGLQE
jgi:ABC-2 type transport system ATP-binding protein